MRDSKSAIGHVWSVVTGIPSRAHVLIEADICWRLDGASSWLLTPAAICVTGARQIVRNLPDVIDEVATIASNYRSGYRALVTEGTGSPSLFPMAQSRYSNVWPDGINDVRLIPGSGMATVRGATNFIPIATLVSNFHGRLETRRDMVSDNLHGYAVPVDTRLMTVNFTRYADAGDNIPLAQLQSDLSSATDLRSVKAANEEEFVLPSPKEALAAGLNLLHWCASERSPAPESYAGGSLSRGYNFNGGSLRRGVSL